MRLLPKFHQILPLSYWQLRQNVAIYQYLHGFLVVRLVDVSTQAIGDSSISVNIMIDISIITIHSSSWACLKLRQ